MKIIILRHGEAESFARSDEARNLTPTGKTLAHNAGLCLKQLGLQPDTVWASSLVRARQTCTEVLSALQSPVSMHTSEQLIPEANPVQLINELSQLSFGTLLLVSHQPLVSALVGLLCDNDKRAGPPMSPTSMALLQTDIPLAGCCELQWLRHAPHFDAV